ncbi:MAG TPA: saccharopine dehydrogenase C-terminal domain-containing protein [Usitatibacter sp.]|nr:saccharopine dehydrogenase C-terminal domain-containing protein [Usitatibacter sp.]
MTNTKKHAAFSGKLVMMGFGSIGQAVLPLLLRHLDVRASQVRIVSKSADRSGIAAKHDVAFDVHEVKRSNYAAILDRYLGPGDFLLNLSVEVGSAQLIEHCLGRGILYLDTCIEPWPGRTEDASLPPTQRSNYMLREEALALRERHPEASTALVTMGANPGLASVFVKEALLGLAKDLEGTVRKPASREDWARLAQRLGVKVIHVAERDTQVAARRKERGEFVNTWSVNGFIGEGLQPSELGWGTHERHFPEDGARHPTGRDSAIYLDRPGVATRVRSWTPLEGPYHGFLITHGETISISDYLTLKDGGDEVVYRPTVHYAYHPCDDAVLSLHELAGKNWVPQERQRIVRDEIVSGIDELGVLLMGHRRTAYWYGSRLTIEEARRLAPFNSATTLQVVAGILGGMVWVLRNPRRGVVEPDDVDHDLVMEIARPYLGEMAAVYGDWTPLRDRNRLFSTDLDAQDPWQFRNFRVR